MRLTTKGRYAVTAMLDLALHSQNKPVSLADISSRQEISLSYLEQLFSKLRSQELVTSVRGPGGGYKLRLPAEDIDIAAIVDAVNESVNVTNCGGKGNCQRGHMCLTHHLWCDLSDQLHGFLKGINLASLIERNEIKTIAARQDGEQSATIKAANIINIKATNLGDEVDVDDANSGDQITEGSA
jgi:Rrf2 family iron-sulfur cluster assembly transcriptional regulator